MVVAVFDFVDCIFGFSVGGAIARNCAFAFTVVAFFAVVVAGGEVVGCAVVTAGIGGGESKPVIFWVNPGGAMPPLFLSSVKYLE